MDKEFKEKEFWESINEKVFVKEENLNDNIFKNFFKKVNIEIEDTFIYDNKESIGNFIQNIDDILKMSNPLLYYVNYEEIVKKIAKEYMELKNKIKYPITETNKDNITVKSNFHLRKCGLNAVNHHNVKECKVKI